MKRQLLWMTWPAFLVASILEMVVFAFVDPADVRWMGKPIALTPTGVYSLAFFLFWSANFACSALVVWLIALPRKD